MNKDIELDYKDELFSLIDRLSENIKKTCEDMEAKARPELKNDTYAILYDKLTTALEIHLNEDDLLKLIDNTKFFKNIDYKKLLFDSINKNQSECDKQDLYSVFKILESGLINDIRNADNNEFAQKYGIKFDIDKEEDVKFLKEKLIELIMNASYKELYTKYIQCLGSYVDFKVSLSRSADLIFYRNKILSRNEKWDKLIENEKEEVYKKVLPLIKEGFSQHKGPKILPKSLTTDLNEQINIANEIADKLKEVSFSHKVLRKLSEFYKDLSSLNKIDEDTFKTTKIDINGTPTAYNIKLTSTIMLNVLRIEFKHFAQVGILPNYQDDTIKKLEDDFVKAEEQYPKLAATIIKNIFNEHGVFTKRATNNKYGLKDKNGNLLQLPNYVAVMIYEILAELGLCITATQGYETFEDNLLRSKKEMARNLLQDESNAFGSIDVKQLFSDYNKFLILSFAKESEKNNTEKK